MDNIVENNKLIAEFMGMELMNRTHEGWQPSRFNFHNSWDSLFPVITKCKDIAEPFDFASDEYYQYEDIFSIDNMFSEFLAGDIKGIYSRVVEFIQWYNKTA